MSTAMRKNSLPKQHALPLQEQCASVASEEASTNASVPLLETIGKGDAEYLALAKEVRDDIVTFVHKMDEGGGPECLINCDDYGDVVLTHHIHRIEKCLRLAKVSAKAVVAALETRILPFRSTQNA